MRVKCLALLLYALALAFTPPAGAAASPPVSNPNFPVLELGEDSPGRLEVGPRMGVLVDNSRSLGLEPAKAAAGDWQPILRQSPNFGFTQSSYWFRFQLHNRSAKVLARFIELPIPFLDDVRLFHFVGSSLQTEYRLGDEQAFAQRAVRHRNFVMPVQLAPGRNDIYLRLASSGTIEAPLRIWDPVQFHAASNDENLAQGAVIGILLIMVVYNLFVFVSTRDINYLYYICFVASYLLFHLTLTGYTFAYVWPQAVHWNSFAISTFAASSAVFTCLFTESFLKLRSFSKPAFYAVRSMMVCSMALFLLSFVLPYAWTIRVAAAVTLPITLTALFLGYWRWWAGARFARFYCLAWTAILIGIAVLNATKFGWIPINLWTENASQIGIVMLVILLSFTLADRINNDRTLRLNAQAVALGHARQARASQEALIRTKEEANRELEQRVLSRTNDLNAAMEQLSQVNARLQLLSTTDGLTQIGNRAYFDAAAITEMRRAERQKGHLSIILLDIDHFKAINDTFGHPAGDACLRALADMLRPRIDRAGDILARYGGEEFVIALTGVDLAASIALAEELRRATDRLRVEFDGKPLRFTASFGVVSAVPNASLSLEDLVAAADRALYAAKHDGRNCVRHASVI
ncbi:MAG: 7TM diverse intracellular signaling domain-containing protein [Pseudomonadota bacterium]